MTHHTKDKGDLAVALVIADLVKKEYNILFNMSEHLSFDIVAYKNKKFIRVQVKYISKLRGSVTITASTSWNDKNGNHKKAYDKSEIDVFAVYCPDTNDIYYINPNSFNKTLTLRIDPLSHKIGNFSNINWAEQYKDISKIFK